MAYWIATSNGFTATSGSATAEQTVELVITNIIDGVHSDYNIEAKNFKVGNGSELVSGSNEWTPTGGVFWNADANVSKVLFENIGTAGQPDNTVKATVTLSAFTPTDAITLYVDIDERTDNPLIPSSGAITNLCLEAHNVFNSNQTVTHTSLLSTVTIANVATGSSGVNTRKKISGYITGDQTVDVASVKFEADTGYALQVEALSSYFNMPTMASNYQNGAWSTQEPVTVYEDGVLTEVTFVISYTPISSAAGLPESFLCDQGVTWTTSMYPYFIPVGSTTSSIDDVVFESSATSLGGGKSIKVFGTVGAAYAVSVQKKTSLTSTVTAGTAGHYNFITGEFQDAETTYERTIGVNGVSNHTYILPVATADTRYDITISGLVDAVQTTLAAGVPTQAGDAIVTQYGVATLTITPVTNTASNFGTLPADVAVTKAISFTGSGYSRNYKATTVLTGGTGGSSSTRLVMDKNPNQATVIAGMTVTGTGVTHLATVVSVKDNIITLSAASTIANSTTLSFSDTLSLVPFSFTVVPNATPDALSVTAGVGASSATGGLGAFQTSCALTATKTRTHVFASTLGIVPGMVVTGRPGNTIALAVDAGVDLTVASVTNAATAVLSASVSMISGDLFSFSSANTSSSVELHSMQVTKVGSNILITGYLDVNNIGETAQVRIYIDPLITVA
tara:strand:+ start:2195 stop:4231 length:2037 start_codon:yes stop_codon:yes gene_type:complete